MNPLLSLMSGGSHPSVTYVDDVFAAVLRTGTGASATITSGIDLSTNGGTIWTKGRSGATSHKLTDTARGVQKGLSTDTQGAEASDTNGITAISTTGHTVGSDSNYNTSSATYVDWVFRQADKFHKVVTWTGDNVSTGRAITHTLNGTVGQIVVKATSAASTDWYVWHRGLTSGYFLKFNTTNAQSNTLAATIFGNGTSTVDPTSTTLTVGLVLNATGVSYVAYLFAHDTSATGLIQCGSFTTDSSGLASVTLGWEPQFIVHKVTSAAGYNWRLLDTMRGMTSTTANILVTNLSDAESADSVYVTPTATGFTVSGAVASATYIYLAIRRPNKPPTSGTQVYNANTRTGTAAAATVTGVGFAPDIAIIRTSNVGYDFVLISRLVGTSKIGMIAGGGAEVTGADGVLSFDMDGMHLGADASQQLVNRALVTIHDWFFKRAPGVIDQIVYESTGSNMTTPHNLGVAPELWIVKNRPGGSHHEVGSVYIAATEYLDMRTTAAKATGTDRWNSTYPSSTVLTLGTASSVNQGTGALHVAYFFATLAGISKVGTFTGNGTSQTINCGFAAGARFIMIKRIDSTGDWYIWDTLRGIVSGNDPHYSLNSVAIEITTDDSIDPDASGFIVNQVSGIDVNVNAATYIFLAIA